MQERRGRAEGATGAPCNIARPGPPFGRLRELGPGNAQQKQSDAAFEDCKKQTEERIHKLLSIKGHRTVNDIHRELGNIMWEYVGMARNEAGLKTALEKIPALRAEFWENVNVLGSAGSFNQNLERAGRVADFLEFAEVLTLDALHRKESCGGHFREESQTDCEPRDDSY